MSTVSSNIYARSLNQPCFLEAHFYSGGLQVKTLGSTRVRPSWAPNIPDKFVGLREEFSLRPNDVAIEFARFKLEPGRATWVGVYKRSVDQRFGDRGNHAGIGVWLLEHNVSQAYLLMDALRKLLEVFQEKGVDAIAIQSDDFLRDYMPGYIRPIPELPSQLSGWPFSRSHYSETALFSADAADPGVWRAVAEHVSRWTVLPPENSNVSRGVILVSTTPRMDPAVKLLQAPSISEMIEYIPEALRDITAENKSLSERAARAQQLSAELESERAASAKLREDLQRLEQLVSENDAVARFVSIDRHLGALGAQMDRLVENQRPARSVPRIAEAAPRLQDHDQFDAQTRPTKAHMGTRPIATRERYDENAPAEVGNWISGHGILFLSLIFLVVAAALVFILLARQNV